MKLKYFYIIFLFLLLFGCSKNKHSNSTKTVFKYNEAAGVSSLDPAFAKDLSNIWVCKQLNAGLVQLNDDLEVVPSIARGWEVSEDGLIYKFHLRDDVYFHDHKLFINEIGRRVLASDFVYSFRRIINKSIASPGLWVFNSVETNNEEYSFSAPDDSTFIIKLKHTFPPFLGILSMQYCSVVPFEIVDYYGAEFRENPIGAGAFKFQMWKEGQKLILLKNEKYFEKEGIEKLPYLDAVSISFLVDKQSAFLQFIQKKLDFMSGIDASYKDELLTKEGELKEKYKDKINLVSQAYLNTEYLGFMLDDNLVSDAKNPLLIKEIRQAINYGFDRKKMMRYLRNNIGSPALAGIIPKGLPGHRENIGIQYSYNPDKARQLLLKSGYAKISDIPEIVLVTNAEYLDLCSYVQHELNDIGLKVKIDVNPPAALRELKAQAKLPFFRASWIADYPDAENYLSMFYSKNFCPNGPNYTHFNNPEFDKLYELSLSEIDINKRIQLYTTMDEIISQEAAIVVLYYDEVLRFTQKNIYGLGSNAINLLDLKRVKKVNKK